MTDPELQTELFAAVRAAAPRRVAALLARPGVDVNGAEPGAVDVVPLVVALACEPPCEEVVRVLLVRRELDLARGPSPLGAAAPWPGVCDALLAREDLDPNRGIGGAPFQTPLAFAVRRGHAQLAARLLARADVDVNLHHAGWGPVHALVPAAPLLRRWLTRRFQPLFHIDATAHPDIVQLLLARKDLQLDQRYRGCFNTALHSLAHKGDVASVTTLIGAGANWRLLGTDDRSVFACESGAALAAGVLRHEAHRFVGLALVLAALDLPVLLVLEIATHCGIGGVVDGVERGPSPAWCWDAARAVKERYGAVKVKPNEV